MEDIAPRLIEDTTAEFHRLYDSSAKIQNLLKKMQQGTATYAEAQEYSQEVSRLIGKAYEKHVSSATLPDGRMYYNIASRLIPSTLDENYRLVSDYAARAQQALNQKAGIGLKAQTAPLSEDRVSGLVDAVSNAEWYDDAAHWLFTAIENFSQNIVDRTIQTNADFHAKAGLSPKIVRKAEGKCCKWCRHLAGEFDYSDLPDDIYRRHENCRCTVLYDPADGSKKLQNVHSKQWTDAGERDRMESRKSYAPTKNSSGDRMLHTKGDPMVEVTGPGEQSHPGEIARFRSEIVECGAELIEKDHESLGYCPGFLPGQPGQVHVSKGASYSAWLHEMQHMRDDREAGWTGMRIMQDKDARYERERVAYGIEVELARNAGREDIAERLLANLEEERRTIYGY